MMRCRVDTSWTLPIICRNEVCLGFWSVFSCFRSRSRSLSISSVSSVSSSAGSLSGNEVTPKKPQPRTCKLFHHDISQSQLSDTNVLLHLSAQDRGRAKAAPPSAKDRPTRPIVREIIKKPPERPRIVTKTSKDPLKQSSAGKPQIKLTLLKVSCHYLMLLETLRFLSG